MSEPSFLDKLREFLFSRCRFASVCGGYGSCDACRVAGDYYGVGRGAGCYRRGGLPRGCGHVAKKGGELPDGTTLCYSCASRIAEEAAYRLVKEKCG